MWESCQWLEVRLGTPVSFMRYNWLIATKSQHGRKSDEKIPNSIYLSICLSVFMYVYSKFLYLHAEETLSMTGLNECWGVWLIKWAGCAESNMPRSSSRQIFNVWRDQQTLLEAAVRRDSQSRRNKPASRPTDREKESPPPWWGGRR